MSSRAMSAVVLDERDLTELEQQGFVQLSANVGISHGRIAAITKAGRELLL
jgi:hypothetical protein